VFATTTVLNFAKAFDPPEIRDFMAALLVSDCRFYGAVLYGYVVMQHHIHVVLRPPPSRTQSWLFQRLKSNSAKLVLPQLTDEVRREIAPVEGLNDRLFWMDGFRGLPLVSEDMFWQKMHYIHENPIRSGLATGKSDYRWSSARWVEAGLMDYEAGLPAQPILDFFGIPPERLSVADQLRERRDLGSEAYPATPRGARCLALTLEYVAGPNAPSLTLAWGQ
jgi:REP element-mobilizing transposase RayT